MVGRTSEQMRTLEPRTGQKTYSGVDEHRRGWRIGNRKGKLAFLSSGSDQHARAGTHGTHRPGRGSGETTPGVWGGGEIPEGKIQYLIRGVTISPVSSAQVRVDSPS